MVNLDSALDALRLHTQLLMRDSAVVTREDGSTFNATKVKIERSSGLRSNDEQDAGPSDTLNGMAYFPFDSPVRTGMRVQTSVGTVWYVTDDNAEETIRGTLEATLYRQDTLTPVREVTLFRQDMTGELVEVGTYSCRLVYAGLMPTILDSATARVRRVDLTIIGDGSFPARPGDMFAFGGLSGQVLDVQKPAVNRVEATCQVQRGTPG